ncbi:MAG: NAD(P)H-hydrate dehydratase [Lachnospiraceae bacterium]|nr:NAD(P)H-hydrate dehydratase [Lachnospiraceae bacterium]
MIEIVSAAGMKRRDQYTIEEIGVPSAVLMERASLTAAEEAVKLLAERGKSSGACAAVLCGSGNNGGDGFACARILTLRGVPCRILFAGNPAHMTEETRRQYEIARRLEIPITEGAEESAAFLKNAASRWDILVDALFGIGLCREVGGAYAELIDLVNQAGRPVLAVDIPSGIDADTGAVCGHAVRADVTVTMQLAKPGLFLYPGCLYTGRPVTAEIGVVGNGEEPLACALEDRDLSALLPQRKEDGNKGTFGKVLLVAGSHNMAGAAVLAASAALRTGCGMVKVLTSEVNRVILQTALPEAMLSTWTTQRELLDALKKAVEWADVIACGPGLGTDESTALAVRKLLTSCEKPLVLDADALNVIAADASLQELLRQHSTPVIVTPHMGEMARLTGKKIGELKEAPLQEAAAFAEKEQVIVVMKDARTVTAVPDGRRFLNLSGCSGMATAGSGDVLTGITAGLLAQGTEAPEAGALGAFLHGRAGEYAASVCGKRFMKAGDIIEGLSEVLKDMESEKQQS